MEFRCEIEVHALADSSITDDSQEMEIMAAEMIGADVVEDQTSQQQKSPTATSKISNIQIISQNHGVVLIVAENRRNR